MYNTPTIVLFVTFFLLGGLVVNFFWRRHQRKILKSLNSVIQDEKTAGVGKEFKEPGDVEKAIKTLLISRQEEIDRMRTLENYRRDYIGNVAHELKTPIFTIQGYLESLSDELKEKSPDLDSMELFLSKAEKNTDRLSRIIGDLDTITKYESGFLTLEFESFNLHELVKDVIDSLELQAIEKQVHLQDLTLPDDFMVWADRFRIRQVLTNLAYNSIKYGKHGGTTKFRLHNVRNKVIVEVADNGIGIPSSHINRIFERFYRVENSRSRDSGGSGLGLSICKHIIEAHGETISVLSTEGAGSVFSFGLKIKNPDA